jgi:UDP-N-acetylglucosamine 2-epimerase (non-hydrolysing)
METDSRIKLLFVLGTRPELIKMAPVIKEAARHRDSLETVLCVTAQHRELLDSMIEYFGLVPDHDLDVMVEDQSIVHVLSQSLTLLGPVIAQEEPHLILVQGDTTTCFAVALAAFYNHIPLGHIEAGLRTHVRYFPFPEEKHRQMTSCLATYHFAPTADARENLLKEGIDPARITVTGNTVIDAVRYVLETGPTGALPAGVRETVGKKLLLVTAHRRESFGKPLEEICGAVRRLVREHRGIHVVFPVHPNPQVRRTVTRILDGEESVSLLAPLAYPDFIHLMTAAHLIMTDSGGIQEEACYLGKRVLLMRDCTERPEAAREGFVTLAGRNENDIYTCASALLGFSGESPAGNRHVYGDGNAAQRIIRHILDSRQELLSRGEGSFQETEKNYLHFGTLTL